MTSAGTTSGTIGAAAVRLAAILAGQGLSVDASAGDLVIEPEISVRPLRRGDPPGDVWAVDGGQALVADARCLQVLVTRAARVRFRQGSCVLEDEGELRAHLLGGGEERLALAALATASAGLGVGIAADAPVDANLLRDGWEWEAVERCLDEVDPGGLVLLDGDLQPDWRIPGAYAGALLRRAAERGVLLAAVTKHSSLSRGGAPLLGRLEMEAAATLGPRAMWWAPVARTRPDLGVEFAVVAARLDPDAPFAFRVDLPAGVEPEAALGALAALCDDAAFPGYPYPLAVADRLAACPGWLRREARFQLDDHLGRAGVPAEVRHRAFADRHDLMERV